MQYISLSLKSFFTIDSEANRNNFVYGEHEKAMKINCSPLIQILNR